MGISDSDLLLLLRLREEGLIADSASIVEIGAQQLSDAFLRMRSEVDMLGRKFGVTTPAPIPEPFSATGRFGQVEEMAAAAPLAREFWTWLGLEYASIDVDGSEGSLALDLNYDNVPEDACGKYDLVTNFGTTEHIANQFNAFKVIHDLASVGGIMIHHLPACGMINHGFVNYTPEFFSFLARSNGYKVLENNFQVASTTYTAFPEQFDEVTRFAVTGACRREEVRIADGGLQVALQKVVDKPFSLPCWSFLEEKSIPNIDDLALVKTLGVAGSDARNSKVIELYAGSKCDCNGAIKLDFADANLPLEASGKYQFVVSNNAIEHTANLLSAFQLIHELTAHGGLMIHKVPAYGIDDPGFFRFHPKLFWMLCRSNGYKILSFNYQVENVPRASVPSNRGNLSANQLQGDGILNANITTVIQKMFDIPFVAPIDIMTGISTDNVQLRQRYWTVFNSDAFSSLPQFVP